MALHHEYTTRKYIWTSGQKVAVTATSAQSTAIPSNEVMLTATSAMYINVGANPTAAASAGSMFLAAGEKIHIRITVGELIAAVRDTADGSLYILPVN